MKELNFHEINFVSGAGDNNGTVPATTANNVGAHVIVGALAGIPAGPGGVVIGAIAGGISGAIGSIPTGGSGSSTPPPSNTEPHWTQGGECNRPHAPCP